MMQYGATFGFVGLAFTGVDCFAETVRGKTAGNQLPLRANEPWIEPV